MGDLVEAVTFKAHGRYKTGRKSVVTINRGPIDPGCQDNWESVQIRVPALPPTELGRGCFIISVQYFLDFHVDPTGIGFDLIVSIPITIGTIPLRQTFQFLAPPPTNYVTSVHTDPSLESPWQPTAPPHGFTAYPDLPLPTYAESVFGLTDMHDEDESEYTGGNFNFAPRYVTYNTQ